MENTNLLSIGKIVNTFGIKGDVKIALHKNIEITDLSLIKLFFIKDKNNILMPKQVETIKWQKNVLIVRFKDVNHIDQVENLKGKEVEYMNENSAFEITYDLTHYNVKYKNKNGAIIDTMFNGHHDLIKVQLEKETKSFWVPLVEVYTEEIDDLNRVVLLKNIEGLK